MATGYGISGIGSPLGTYGLGSSGSYGAYDNYMPSMMGMSGMGLTGGMGMNGSLFNMGGMSPYGGMMGMGMYNPTYWQQMQNDMEKLQLTHAGEMHDLLKTNEVKAHDKSYSTIIEKVLTDADVQEGVDNVYHKIVTERDLKGACEEFRKLKEAIFTNHRAELEAREGTINAATSATRLAEVAYSNLVTSKYGRQTTLRDDLLKFGEGAFENGFMQGMKKGHSNVYLEEAMNDIYGLEIEEKGSKDLRQKVGKGLGVGASSLEKGVYGATAGLALAGVGTALYKGIMPQKFKAGIAAKIPLKTGTLLKKAGIIGFLGGAALDLIWKFS